MSELEDKVQKEREFIACNLEKRLKSPDRKFPDVKLIRYFIKEYISILQPKYKGRYPYFYVLPTKDSQMAKIEKWYINTAVKKRQNRK